MVKTVASVEKDAPTKQVVSTPQVTLSESTQEKTSEVQESKTTTASSTRPKSTFNLNSILKAKEQPATVITPIEEPKNVKPLTEEQLREAWTDYATLRKGQVAEFHLLSRQMDINGSVVTVALANSVEEPLLQSMMTDLVTYLRNRLGNSTIKVESVMQEADTKKIAYTNKEKFDLLVEKNPLLNELKDRLGLDPDF